MIPFNNGFRIVLPQRLNSIVCQMAMIALYIDAADQLSLVEVCDESSINSCIRGAPFLVGLQVNQPYFMIITVR